jgi:hypothetical protein
MNLFAQNLHNICTNYTPYLQTRRIVNIASILVVFLRPKSFYFTHPKSYVCAHVIKQKAFLAHN